MANIGPWSHSFQNSSSPLIPIQGISSAQKWVLGPERSSHSNSMSSSSSAITPGYPVYPGPGCPGMSGFQVTAARVEASPPVFAVFFLFPFFLPLVWWIIGSWRTKSALLRLQCMLQPKQMYLGLASVLEFPYRVTSFSLFSLLS